MLFFGLNGVEERDRYTPRHVVFGIATKNGKVACAAVKVGSRTYLDLPGGGIDQNEDEEQALVREFDEETGLTVKPLARLAEVGQYYRSSDGRTFRFNYGGFWVVTSQLGKKKAKEPNHRLVWLDPATAIAGLRHESHAWFLLKWLRWDQRDRSHNSPAEAADALKSRVALLRAA